MDRLEPREALYPSHSLMCPATPIGRGASRRLGRQFREAFLAATDNEIVDLQLLDRLVELGHISVPDASETLRGVLREQNERAQRAA